MKTHSTRPRSVKTTPTNSRSRKKNGVEGRPDDGGGSGLCWAGTVTRRAGRLAGGRVRFPQIRPPNYREPYFSPTIWMTHAARDRGGRRRSYRVAGGTGRKRAVPPEWMAHRPALDPGGHHGCH